MSLLRLVSWACALALFVLELKVAHAQTPSSLSPIQDWNEARWRDLSPADPPFDDLFLLELVFREHPFPVAAKWLLNSRRLNGYVLPTAIFNRLVKGLDEPAMRPAALQILLLTQPPTATGRIDFQRGDYRMAISNLVSYLFEDQAASEIIGDKDRASEDRMLLAHWAELPDAIDGLKAVGESGSLQAFAALLVFLGSRPPVVGQLVLGEVSKDRWAELALQVDIAPLFAQALRGYRFNDLAGTLEGNVLKAPAAEVGALLSQLSLGDYHALTTTADNTLFITEQILVGKTRFALPVLRTTGDRTAQLVVLSLLASGIDPASGDLLSQFIAIQALNDPELRRAAGPWLVRNPPLAWVIRQRLSATALGLPDEPMAGLAELTLWRNPALQNVNAEITRRGMKVPSNARDIAPAKGIPTPVIPLRGSSEAVLYAALAHERPVAPVPDPTSLRAHLLSNFSQEEIFAHVADPHDPARAEALLQLADRLADLRELFDRNPGVLPAFENDIRASFGNRIKLLLLLLQGDARLYRAVLENLAALGTTRLELGQFTPDVEGLLIQLSESAQNPKARAAAKMLLTTPR